MKNEEEIKKIQNKNYNYEFLEFINSFEKEFQLNIEIPIEFTHLNEDTAGVCLFTRNKKSILISYDYWNKISKSQKEELIYHELGHCVFNLEHDDSRMFLKMCPNSVMHSKVFNDYESKICYILFKKHYVTDLYKKISNKK